MSDIFRTLIVPTSNVDLAQSIAASFGPSGDGMWTTPLSSTGNDPATHYISSGYVPMAYSYLVPSQTWEQNEDGEWIIVNSTPGDPVAVYAHCVESGVECTQEEIDELFAVVDVTEQGPFTAMERLGLSMIEGVAE